MQSRTSLPSWQTLVQHANNIKSHHMSDMFCEDKNRFNKFSIQLNPFLLDYSKNLNRETQLFRRKLDEANRSHKSHIADVKENADQRIQSQTQRHYSQAALRKRRRWRVPVG